MNAWKLLQRLAGLMAVIHLNVQALAHEGPEHEIAELTAEIAKGETADLYLQRAIEYRVINKQTEAAHDLELAIRLAPELIFAHRELGRVYFALGKTNEALDTITHALKIKTEEPTETASLHIARADILKARGELKKALEDCEKAIKLHPENVDWYMSRSDLHERLKQPKERLEGVAAGIKATGSWVLEVEYVEALLDDKQFDAALKKIEPELQASRIQSSWLTRRARAKLGLGQKAEAKADLEAALEEMRTRLNPNSPDVNLLTERAQAYELLEDRELARHSYEQARDAGAEEWVKEKIKALKAEEDAEKEGKTKDKDKKKDKGKDSESGKSSP